MNDVISDLSITVLRVAMLYWNPAGAREAPTTGESTRPESSPGGNVRSPRITSWAHYARRPLPWQARPQ